MVHALCLTIYRAGKWVDVTEALSSESGTLPPIEAFEGRWRFEGAGSIGEVFTPSLVPEEGDLVGRHVFRAPALVIEGTKFGAAVAVDINLLEKSCAVPSAMTLLRGTHDDADLVVGLHTQKVRGHVFFTAGPEVTPLGTGTLLAPLPRRPVPDHREGHLLNGARRKTWALGQLDRLARRLLQSSAEYARQIFPGAIDLLWRQTCDQRPQSGCHHREPLVPRRRMVFFVVQPPAQLLRPLPLRDGPGRARTGWKWPGPPGAWPLPPPAPGVFSRLFLCSARTGGSRATTKVAARGSFTLWTCPGRCTSCFGGIATSKPTKRPWTRAREYAKALAGLQRPDGGLPAYVDAEGTAGNRRGPTGPHKGPRRPGR